MPLKGLRAGVKSKYQQSYLVHIGAVGYISIDHKNATTESREKNDITNQRSRCTPQRCSTKLRHQDIQQKQDDQDRQRHNLGILPPHLSSYRSGATSEGGRLGSHGVGLVEEEFDAFATAENLFHVFDHDVFDLVEFCLGASDFVGRWGGVVGVHEGGDRG